MRRSSLRMLAAALAAAACAGPAAAVDFPGAGGNLADPTAWGGTLPASTADVTFRQGGTFTASGDVSFRTVTVAAQGLETAFDFRSKNAKLTLTGGADTYGLTYSANNFQRIRMYGGVWDFNGAMFRNGHDGVGGHINMFLQSGVVVTNVSKFYWAKHAQPGSGYTYTCNIQEGAKVHTTGDLLNYATGWNAKLNISGGAQVTVGGLFYSDQFGNPDNGTGHHAATVTGAGTLLEIKGGGQNYIGHTHRCNSLTVADHARIVATSAPTWLGNSSAAVSNAFVVTGGASADLGTMYVGHGNGTFGNRYIVSGGAHATNAYFVVGGDNGSDNLTLHDNFAEVEDAELYVRNWTALGNSGKYGRLTVKAGGVFSTSELNIGSVRGTTSSGNVFEALAGATVTTRGGIVKVGTCGDNNRLVVSNASFTAGNLTVGAAGRRGSSVHVYGPGCTFTLANKAGENWDVFGATRDGLVEFRDGAVFDVYDTYLRLGSYATNCTLRIAGGAYFYATNRTSSIGRNNCASISNRMELLDESFARTVRWRLTSEDGCMVVSNSTFETTHTDGFDVGYRETSGTGQTSAMTGNRWEMQGDHPKARTPGQFKLRNRSTLHLQVPPKGYAKGYALIEAKTFILDDADSRLTVDMDEYSSKVGGRITVAQTTGGVTLNATALAASNALLPKGCKFATSADGKVLYLNVPSRRGTVICVR